MSSNNFRKSLWIEDSTKATIRYISCPINEDTNESLGERSYFEECDGSRVEDADPTKVSFQVSTTNVSATSLSGKANIFIFTIYIDIPYIPNPPLD